MNMETLLVILIGVMVLMGGIQAVQLGMVASALSNGAAVSAAAAPAGAVPAASALANLPTQVGGCG